MEVKLPLNTILSSDSLGRLSEKRLRRRYSAAITGVDLSPYTGQSIREIDWLTVVLADTLRL